MKLFKKLAAVAVLSLTAGSMFAAVPALVVEDPSTQASELAFLKSKGWTDADQAAFEAERAERLEDEEAAKHPVTLASIKEACQSFRTSPTKLKVLGHAAQVAWKKSCKLYKKHSTAANVLGYMALCAYNPWFIALGIGFGTYKVGKYYINDFKQFVKNVHSRTA